MSEIRKNTPLKSERAEFPQKNAPHVPVLLDPILEYCAPIEGTWLDGTLGAGGYARALLSAGAAKLVAIDQDPLAIELAQSWIAPFKDRIHLIHGPFSQLDHYVHTYIGDKIDGVVLDLGVSSMQLDIAERGFSFQKDGPLDMRMSQSGPSAADIVNTASQAQLADILYHYGEERASRRIARAIVKVRENSPITRTKELVDIVSACLPAAKYGQSHPATRSFQALRIAVNAEFDELYQALFAAERVLKAGGFLAVVTFHSLEDRICKRFFQFASGQDGNANRYAPMQAKALPRFNIITKRAIIANAKEQDKNPRARSAKLRIGQRTSAASLSLEEIRGASKEIFPSVPQLALATLQR